MLILRLMIEPAWADACVCLARTPDVAILHPIVQHLVGHFTVVVKQTPVRLAHIACLGAHPAQITTIAAIIPDKALRLQLTDHLVCLRPLVVSRAVNLSRLIGTAIPTVATIGTIKPHLEDLTVVGEQLAQLVAEIGDVCWSPVFRMIAIPRREVDGKRQSFFATGISQLAHHIALAVLPRRVLHGIVRISRGPHAKPAMMLGGEDDATHTCLFTDTRPLPTVKILRVKQLGIFIAEAPLLICIGVQRVMDECVHLHVLPAQLVLAGHRALRLHRHRQEEGAEIRRYESFLDHRSKV